jgi:hypothetical protein
VARSPFVRILCLLALAASCSAALGATAAIAAVEYKSVGSFGSGPGSESGQFNPVGRVAAYNSAGEIFVADPGNTRVQVFAAAGDSAGYLTQFGAENLVQPVGIAVDQATGSVYVSDAGAGQIFKFDSDGAPKPVFTLDPSFTSPLAGIGAGELGSFAAPLAFDDANGRLLVADPSNNLIDSFQPDGTFVSSFDGSSSGAAFTALKDVAALAGGDLAVVDGGRVVRFDSSGADLGTLTGLPAEPGRVAFNAAGGEILVSHEGIFAEATVYRVAVTTGQFIASLPSFSESSNRSISGMAVLPGALGHLYVGVGPDSFCGCIVTASDVSVYTVNVLPDVTIAPASEITETTAHFAGTIDPAGKPEISYRFEYSRDGGVSWEQTPVQPASEGVGAEVVEADVTGLEPNDHYQVRLVGSNSAGENASGVEEFLTLQSAPGAVTGIATDRTSSSANLHGTVSPYGLQSTYHFEYGTTTAYGAQVPAAHEGIAGGGHKPLEATQLVGGLQSGTTYHYRLVAHSSAGLRVGEDMTFATRGSGVSRPSRGYELVSPNASGSTAIGEISAQAKPDGNGLVFGSYSAEPGPEAEGAPQLVLHTSLRGPDGWLARSISPPTLGNQAYAVATNIGVSEDLSQALVPSDRALTPGAFEGGGNVYLRDFATGKYTFIAGNPDHGAFAQYALIQQANKFLGGAADFSWVVFISEYPFTPEATPGVANVYRWSAATGLELISVMPDGSPVKGTTQLSNVSGPELNRVSRDGSVVAFNVESGGEGEGVYARLDGATTVPLSVSQIPGDPTAPHLGAAIDVGGDGSYADFFTVDEVPLTPDAPARTGNLYRYDLESGALTYLEGSIDSTLFLSGGIRGGIVAVARDTGRIYFAQQGGGLSLWDNGQVTPIFSGSFNNGRTSPDGRYLAFEDNASSRIYLYDALDEETECVTCPGTGRLPISFQDHNNNYLPRSVTEQGEVFFDSSSALVPGDVNGTQDVYAYKDGALTLISPGDGDYEAKFMDASSSGDDVFFRSAQPLVAAVQNRAYNVYDARVGGGIAAQNAVPAPGCAGEACQASSTVPTLAGPAAVSGPGNGSSRHVRCRKGKKTRSARCAGKQRGKRQQQKRNGKARAKSTGRAGR